MRLTSCGLALALLAAHEPRGAGSDGPEVTALDHHLGTAAEGIFPFERLPCSNDGVAPMPRFSSLLALADAPPSRAPPRSRSFSSHLQLAFG
ncbi:MAG: hypothetical protein H6719_19995 [Sandaracinaceae bacterium]|nr:hypothetical protein [Sandaracinaceae bacterium]